jgi:putative ABC transport system permease protein
MSRPPLLAATLLRLLPRDAHEAIAGDLDEEWHTARRRSRARYWRLACASVGSFWWHRLRHLHSRAKIGGQPPVIERETPMRSLLQDVRYGARLMRRTPGFTLAAVGTLALGIGANTAIFSMVNVMSLKPLPYHEPHRVAFVLGRNTERQSTHFNLSLADYADLRRQAQTLEEVAAYSYWSANVTGGDAPERIQAYRVTGNTFSLLGVPALLGRTFTTNEGAPGGPNVVVISHGLWQRRFGSNRSIVGRVVQLDGQPTTIIGVMPVAFEFPVVNFKGDLWAPLPFNPDAGIADRAAAESVVVVARVRRQIEYVSAQAEIDTIMRWLETDHPETNRALGARLIPMGALDDEMVGPVGWILMATVGVVLLLACSNVANLLLARGVARQRELAIRAALGAGRLRVVRQLLVESLLLAAAGATVGAAVAFAALRVLRRSLPELIETTQPNLDALGLDATTFLFTIALCIVTTFVFGVIPAWRAAQLHVHDTLKGSAGLGGGRSTRRLRAALVVLEVTLATTLLVTAGLLVQSYQRQQRLDPGFNPQRVVTMTITLPSYRYGAADAQRRFFEQATDRIARIPGVRSASFVNVLPFSTYDRGGRFTIDGQPTPRAGREPSADFRVVTPAYFQTMEIPVLRGRAFDAGDRADGRPVAIVNQMLARRVFGNQDPLGQRLRLGTDDPARPFATIVGVVGNVHHDQLTVQPDAEIYAPQAQAPEPMMMLAARTEGEPEVLTGEVRAAIRAIDPAQPVYHVKTLERLVADSLLAQTSSAALMTLFSALTLLLAAVGIYGVISYAVGQQTREFGVRVALGARPGDLLALVVCNGLALVITGVLLGAAGALGVSRLIASALYGVTPVDLPTYAAVITLLVIVGTAACSIPAWRASRIEPMQALRVD